MGEENVYVKMILLKAKIYIFYRAPKDESITGSFKTFRYWKLKGHFSPTKEQYSNDLCV